MRPSDAMSLADQALIRDWIIQLAPSYENFVWTTFGVPSGSINTGVADDFNGDGVPNGLEHIGIGNDSFDLVSSSLNSQGTLNFNSNSEGLTLIIQVSDDLTANSWTTVASRLRDESVWRSSPGFSVGEISTGTIQFTDSTGGIDSKFYRFGVKYE